jgi:hypothetical protein
MAAMRLRAWVGIWHPTPEETLNEHEKEAYPHDVRRALENNVQEEDGMVNDSMGTTDTADSTGSDEEKETGDAKKNDTQTRED